MESGVCIRNSSTFWEVRLFTFLLSYMRRLMSLSYLNIKEVAG